MCWLDRKSTETIHRLKDKFGLKNFIETGTFRGINAEWASHCFPSVITCDIDDGYLDKARKRLGGKRNVLIVKKDSEELLKSVREVGVEENDNIFFYLDAHFFSEELEEKWVVRRELKALEGFGRCVIFIHDFDMNGLGHLCYKGEHLNMDIVGDLLLKVYPDFKFYGNTREGCDICDEHTIYSQPITVDEDVLDSIRYAHSAPEKTCRGILYAVPEELDESFGLKEIP